MALTAGMQQGTGPTLDSRSCLSWWADENSSIISRWKAANSSGDEKLQKRTVQECHLLLHKLLQKIQGLPAAVLSLPLELAVLCNYIAFRINVTGNINDKDEEALHHGLRRVLETRGPCRAELSTMELWQILLEGVKAEEMDPSLHQLAGLQGAFLLASNQMQDVTRLFQLLNRTEGSMSEQSGSMENELLEHLRSWPVPEDGKSAYPMAEGTQHLKDMMCTAAAFQQGLQLMEAGDPTAAVEILQEAASGLCSTRVLAQIFTCIGCCYQRMDKPQAALQCWKQALQADFRCLSALYQTSVLYHQLGKADAELDALRLLYEALDDLEQHASTCRSVALIRVELLVQTTSLTSIFRKHHGLEVKYLIAQRSLVAGRVEEAVEHYLDLLALLHEGSNPQLNMHSLATVPRIPVVYLEAASALYQQKRFNDVLTVCEEVVEHTKDLIPETLNIEWRADEQISTNAPAQITRGIGGSRGDLETSHLEDIPDISEHNGENLRCILWASNALLFQGQALATLEEYKDSITHFSRCINLLLKVQIVETGTGAQVPVKDLPGDLKVLVTLKTLALLGRAAQFLELGKEKEALMNLQLCLQVFPGHREATFYLLDVLWKLNRKREAACYWQKFQKDILQIDGQQEAFWRHLPLHLIPHLKENHVQEDVVKRQIENYVNTNIKDS